MRLETAVRKYLDRSYVACSKIVKEHYRSRGVLFRDALLQREIEAILAADMAVLDAGCGPDMAVTSRYAGRVRRLIGADLSQSFTVHCPLEACTGDLSALPFRDAQFDLVVSRSVWEHLKYPSKAFRELWRVLKPGGVAVLTMPNKYDYASIISALLPTFFKRAFLRLVLSDASYENHPTYYRCNTARAIRHMARSAGLSVEKLQAIRHFPYYLMFSPALFRAGIVYDELITRLRLNGLQSGFLCVLRK